MGAIGGAIALPLPVLFGWLSDRIGRKLLMNLGYLAGILSMLILAISTSLWHFWITASLWNKRDLQIISKSKVLQNIEDLRMH